MGLIPPHIALYGALAVTALGFAGGYSLRDTQAKAKEAEQLSIAAQETARMQAMLNEASGRYEEAKRQADVAAAARTTRIKEIYKDVPPTPANCLPPPAVRSMLDGAVADANAFATGQPVQPVPAATAAASTP